MASKAERRRRIFVTARQVFSGANAQLRQKNDVARVIKMDKQLFEPLSKDFGEGKVIDIIMSLLADEIFQSKRKAKIAFPGLNQISVVSSKETTVPDQSAVKSKAEDEGVKIQLVSMHDPGEIPIHENSVLG